MAVSFRHRFEYGALRAVTGVLAVLPLRVALGIGWGLAVVGYALAGRRRREACRRIQSVFGDTRTEREVRRIAWRAWRNLVFNIIELVRTPRLTRAELDRRVDHADIADLVARSTRGEGFIVAVGHLGNWDLAGLGSSLLGVNLFAMMRRQRNPLIDAYLNRLRSGTGMQVIERSSRALAGVIRRLRKGQALAILPDLRAKSREAALPVPFLGGTAWVSGGTALFARHANVPVIVAIATREGWTRHRWTITDPIHPDPSLSRDDDMTRMTRAILARLDRAIQDHPDQYFWFNKRWVLEPFGE